MVTITNIAFDQIKYSLYLLLVGKIYRKELQLGELLHR